jgi:hypothetical protein
VDMHDHADGEPVLRQRLRVANHNEQSLFGFSAALAGNILLVGAKGHIADDSGEGGAYLFRRNTEGDWWLDQQFPFPADSAVWTFGTSVALQGNTAVVASMAAAVYIYQLPATPPTFLPLHQALELPADAPIEFAPIFNNIRGVTDVTHDGVDAVQITLPAHSAIECTLHSAAEMHLWVRTDAAAGKLRFTPASFLPQGNVNHIGYAVQAAQWCPLLISSHMEICNEEDHPVQVWLDTVQPVTPYQYVAPEDISHLYPKLAQTLDYAPMATFGMECEDYAYFYNDAALSHDGTDVAALQESFDDGGASVIVFPATGPATVSFWWRCQPLAPAQGVMYCDCSQQPLHFLNSTAGGPWQQARIQVPAGQSSLRLVIERAYHSRLLIDEYTVTAPDPTGNLSSYLAASGLSGNAAQPTADADHDGFPNLAEYVLGTNPNDPNSSPKAPLQISPIIDPHTGQPSLSIKLSGIRNSALPETEIRFQTTTDLTQPWTDLPSLTASEDLMGGPDNTVIATITVPRLNRAFFRAKFIQITNVIP